MNWNQVRKTNRIRSARKAKREAHEKARKAAIENAGGLITVADLKAAIRRIEPGYGNRIISCDVWTFRGRDWVLAYSDGDMWQAFAPFVSWRMDGHEGSASSLVYVPMTPGAKKFLAVMLATANKE